MKHPFLATSKRRDCSLMLLQHRNHSLCRQFAGIATQAAPHELETLQGVTGRASARVPQHDNRSRCRQFAGIATQALSQYLERLEGFACMQRTVEVALHGGAELLWRGLVLDKLWHPGAAGQGA